MVLVSQQTQWCYSTLSADLAGGCAGSSFKHSETRGTNIVSGVNVLVPLEETPSVS